jgi:hypothetical protein
MRFIDQIFGAGKTGLTQARQKGTPGDGNVVENIFVRPVFWSASEFNFHSVMQRACQPPENLKNRLISRGSKCRPRCFLNSLNRTAQ